MTPTRIALAAVAAFTLAGAANAQSISSSPSSTPNVPTAGDASAMPSTNSGANMPSQSSMDAPAAAAPSASTMGADVSTTVSAGAAPVAGSVTVTTLTNGPVPDTAENRAKYGSPMSRAGKMTRASGN